MRVLLLAKMDDHDRIMDQFVQNFMGNGFELHLLNIVAIPSEIPLKMNGEVIDVCTEYNLSKYYDLKNANTQRLSSYLPGIEVNKKSMIGDPISIVKSYVRENGIDLVLSGGHITSHREDMFSTTFSTQLMRQLSVPYLSIKGDSEEGLKLTTIAVVREFIDPAKRNLELIKILQEQLHAKVVLVKINTPNSHMNPEELSLKMQQFASLNDFTDVEFLTIEASDKETAIKDLVTKHNIDLLTLGHIDRNGISSFLRGDLRSDILNHINIPIYMY